jgi:hypothetical protein
MGDKANNSDIDKVSAILKKPFPPLSKEDFSQLCLLKRTTCETSVRDRIVKFEQRASLTLPVVEPVWPDFIEDIQGKGWWSLSDIFLLSIGIELGVKGCLEMCEEKKIKRFLFPEDFMKSWQMVKGVRVEEETESAAVVPAATAPAVATIIQRPSVDVQQYIPTTFFTDISGFSIVPPSPKRSTGTSSFPENMPTKTDIAILFDPSLDSFRQFSDKLDKNFYDRESISSTALDIIAVYLKGQKILYIESKTHCEQHLHMLMLPAIFISAACTVLTSALSMYPWNTTFIGSLTAMNAFLLSLISYLKLDAKAEAHKTTSYQFDKLQSMCEFRSGKVLFFKDKSTAEIVTEIEEKVAEIKDTNQFILPESIRYRFPILYKTNVFTEVKQIENEENKIKHRLNEIMLSLKDAPSIAGLDETTKKQIEHQLKTAKNREIENYLGLRSKYFELDDKFSKEIDENIAAAKRRWFTCLSWLKN